MDGNSWDVLALGTCWRELPDPKTNPKAAKMVRSWIDPYAPERDDLARQYFYFQFASKKRVRVLGPTKGISCTQGYAVTREGAMRLLYHIGGPGHILDRPVDILMKDQMIAGLLSGFAAIPNVIGQWKYGGWKDSDIQGLEENEVGSGQDIVRSVREEIIEVLGNRNVWEEIEHQEE